MKIEKQIIGSADFSFEYFLKGGFIGWTCPHCSHENDLRLKIYQSGQLIEKLDQELIDDLIEHKIVNIKDENINIDSHLRKYVLWRMNAMNEKIKCVNCSQEMISIFGMAEIQPGREYIQFKGIWSLKST
jgi:ribosomal protein S27E